MSSTITTNRVAAATRTTDERILYVLFEETYCSNVSPRTPRWCCVGLGYLPAVLEKVFALASCCEGGMLRNRAGRLTPEGYLGTWLKELAAPLVMTRLGVTLSAHPGYTAAIPETLKDEAAAVLESHGRGREAEELRTSSRTTLNLATDADAVLDVMKRCGRSVWTIINELMRPHELGERKTDLGYRPSPAKTIELVQPEALKVERDNRLLRRPDGSWHCAGSEYEIIGSFVEDEWRAEMRASGGYRRRIGAFRTALRDAGTIPDDVMVEVDGRAAGDEYDQSRVDEVRKDSGADGEVFRVKLNEKNSYTLTRLLRQATTWILPDEMTRRRRSSSADQVTLNL